MCIRDRRSPLVAASNPRSRGDSVRSQRPLQPAHMLGDVGRQLPWPSEDPASTDPIVLGERANIGFTHPADKQLAHGDQATRAFTSRQGTRAGKRRVSRASDSRQCPSFATHASRQRLAMANRSTASLLTAEQSGTLAGQSDSRTRSGREHCPGQRRGRCPAGSDEADDLAWDEIRLQFLKLTRIASLDVVKPLGFFVHREKATDRGWAAIELELVDGMDLGDWAKSADLHERMQALARLSLIHISEPTRLL